MQTRTKKQAQMKRTLNMKAVMGIFLLSIVAGVSWQPIHTAQAFTVKPQSFSRRSAAAVRVMLEAERTIKPKQIADIDIETDLIKQHDNIKDLVKEEVDDHAVRPTLPSNPKVAEQKKDPSKPTNNKSKGDFSKQVPLGVVAQRVWDTAEDALVHIRRHSLETGGTVLTPEQDAQRKTVVVLGSGWAAHALFKVADCQKLRIIVISPTNHFLFTPMLASAATGTVEFRSMTENVRSANPVIQEYIEGTAIGLNVTAKTVTVQLHQLRADEENKEPQSLTEVPYDHLVVSVGSMVHDFNVKGVNEHALKLKTIDDARKIRSAIGECLEQASSRTASGPDNAEERIRRATFLIAGGGPTGVELAGELCDLIADVTRKQKGAYPNLANSTRVIVVEGGPTLVAPFNEKLRKQALKSLQDQGVEVLMNTFVTKVSRDHVTVSVPQLDPKTQEPLKERSEMEIPVGLTVWAAGTCPQPFVGTLLDQLPAQAKNRDGRVKVDRWMRAPMHDADLLGSVFVVGDAAANPCDEYSAMAFLPPTAQVAGQEGAYLARTLSRGYNMSCTLPQIVTTNEKGIAHDDPMLANWLRFRGLQKAPPFHFLNMGVMAYLGSGEALSQIQLGEVPVFSRAGTTGFLLSRSLYLVKQVATRNRVLVLFDWVKANLFGRDLTRF